MLLLKFDIIIINTNVYLKFLKFEMAILALINKNNLNMNIPLA